MTNTAKEQFLSLPNGQHIAFCLSNYNDADKLRSPLMFIHGLKSDKEGSKALWLDEWCKQDRRSYLRFDCRGHGRSSGEFSQTCIGQWAQDTIDIFDKIFLQKPIVIGSSMGGWLALLLAKKRPKKIAGFIGIAAAPDFTAELIEPTLTKEQKTALANDGYFMVGGDSENYDPYPITQKLLDDGHKHLVMNSPLPLNFPVRLLHGTEDTVVPVSTSLRLLEHMRSSDAQAILVKGADHSFSSEDNLQVIAQTIKDIDYSLRNRS